MGVQLGRLKHLEELEKYGITTEHVTVTSPDTNKMTPLSVSISQKELPYQAKKKMHFTFYNFVFTLGLIYY